MSAEEAHPRIPECPRPSGWSFERDDWFEDRANERRLSAKKRLTDAELAAEYQNSRLISYVRHHRTQNYPGDMVLFDHYERGLEQEWTLERFATLPHYDEPAPDLLNSTRPTKAEQP